MKRDVVDADVAMAVNVGAAVDTVAAPAADEGDDVVVVAAADDATVSFLNNEFLVSSV